MRKKDGKTKNEKIKIIYKVVLQILEKMLHQDKKSKKE
jgi:hypothetical protein